MFHVTRLALTLFGLLTISCHAQDTTYTVVDVEEVLANPEQFLGVQVVLRAYLAGETLSLESLSRTRMNAVKLKLTSAQLDVLKNSGCIGRAVIAYGLVDRLQGGEVGLVRVDTMVDSDQSIDCIELFDPEKWS